MVAALVSIFTVVAFGALSDRYRQVKVYRYAALFQAIIALPGFYLLTLGASFLAMTHNAWWTIALYSGGSPSGEDHHGPPLPGTA